MAHAALHKKGEIKARRVVLSAVAKQQCHPKHGSLQVKNTGLLVPAEGAGGLMEPCGLEAAGLP